MVLLHKEFCIKIRKEYLLVLLRAVGVMPGQIASLGEQRLQTVALTLFHSLVRTVPDGQRGFEHGQGGWLGFVIGFSFPRKFSLFIKISR